MRCSLRADSVLRALIVAVMLLFDNSTAFPAALRQTDKGKISLASLTLSENRFLTLTREGKPVTIWGELAFPNEDSEPFPAVVLAHGCGGLGPTVREWAKQLTSMGAASFALDSFSGRGIQETCTGQSRISRGSRIIDAYRVFELLVTHPRIDPSRIAFMGFSQGGA